MSVSESIKWSIEWSNQPIDKQMGYYLQEVNMLAIDMQTHVLLKNDSAL